jgi:hypothetical protein
VWHGDLEMADLVRSSGSASPCSSWWKIRWPFSRTKAVTNHCDAARAIILAADHRHYGIRAHGEHDWINLGGVAEVRLPLLPAARLRAV